MADRWRAAEAAVERATQLVVMLRDEDPRAAHRLIRSLRRRDPLALEQLVVALAAMVPDDAPVSDLLAWTDTCDPKLLGCDPRLDRSPPGTRAEHGSRSRYVAGCKGDGCSAAQHLYDAGRPRRRRLHIVPSDERAG